MATNRYSCALNVSILLSVIQIVCILYVSYASTFIQEHTHTLNTYIDSFDKQIPVSIQQEPLPENPGQQKVGNNLSKISTKMEKTSKSIDQQIDDNQNDIMQNKKKQQTKQYLMYFVMISIILDAVFILKNSQLKEKYWQKELLAIRITYNRSSEGKRSTRGSLGALDQSMMSTASSNYCGSGVKVGRHGNQLNKKQEKQLILRKLQYDVVSRYRLWYLAIVSLKIIMMGLLILSRTDVIARWNQLNVLTQIQMMQKYIGQGAQQKETANNSQQLSEGILLLRQTDTVSFVIVIILICRIAEVLNFLLIRRWINNIKIDIIKFIRLVKQRNVFLTTDEKSGQATIKEKPGEILGDAIDSQDFKKFFNSIKEIKMTNQNSQNANAETIVVQNLWNILKDNGQTDVNNFIDNKQDRFTNSLLEESIGGFMSEFLEDGSHIADPEKISLLQKRNSYNGPNSLQQLIIDHKSQRSRTSQKSSYKATCNDSLSVFSGQNTGRLSIISMHTSKMAKATIML